MKQFFIDGVNKTCSPFQKQVVSKLSISCRFYEMIPKITILQIVQDFILNVKDAPLEFSHTSGKIDEKLCWFSVY